MHKLSLTILLTAIIALTSPAQSQLRQQASTQQSDTVQTEQAIDGSTSFDSVMSNDSLNTLTFVDDLSTPVEFERDERSPLDGRVIFNEMIVKVVAIISPLAFLIIMLSMVLRYRRRKQLDKLKVIEASIANRWPLPNEFYRSPSQEPTTKLSTGIIWIGIGIATMLFFLMVVADIWPIGIVPFALGVSKIAVYRTMISKQDKNSQIPELPHTEK